MESARPARSTSSSPAKARRRGAPADDPVGARVRYASLMRFVLPASLLLIAFGACSSHSSSATNYTASDGGGADDGSTAACTSVGGTCEAYSAGCPIVQQNPELCGDVLLVCCLPPGGETVAGPDAGAEPTDAGV